MRRYKGYGSYRGRNRGRNVLIVLIVVLLVLLALGIGALIWLDGHVVYSADGVTIDLPFLHGQQPEEDDTPVTVTTPPPATPSPTPTPEPEEPFRGMMLPTSALTDGTAAAQVEAAGANAAIFDMKTDGGQLNYASSLPLAVQTGASATDESLNDAIRQLNDGDVYTVARISCLRDNIVPRAEMPLALHTSAGNWRDWGDYRWLSPFNEQAVDYVCGVCRELAELGFDEILLDNWAFPTQGELSWLQEDDNYDAEGVSQALEEFLQQIDAQLDAFPEVTLSLVTTPTVLEGGTEGGQTLELLSTYADRVLAAPEEGTALPQNGTLEVVSIVEQPGETQESWAVLSVTGE
ncbi:putative glycoside hydrolase [Flavonifractor hominis]|uniref:Glycoside hydrolase n=1 Tax=Flavonifractor hominis TaxID=3133178 RepID=A0ABV1ES08_9FIRM